MSFIQQHDVRHHKTNVNIHFQHRDRLAVFNSSRIVVKADYFVVTHPAAARQSHETPTENIPPNPFVSRPNPPHSMIQYHLSRDHSNDKLPGKLPEVTPPKTNNNLQPLSLYIFLIRSHLIAIYTTVLRLVLIMPRFCVALQPWRWCCRASSCLEFCLLSHFQTVGLGSGRGGGSPRY